MAEESVEVSDTPLGKRKREINPTEEKGEKQNPAPKGNNKKKDKQKFVYGNYTRYYGYRTEGAADPRLNIIKKEWFQGKRCLDIGCNTGQFTLSVGKEFEPRYLLGVDIDPHLIAQAKKTVSSLFFARQGQRKQKKDAPKPTTQDSVSNSTTPITTLDTVNPVATPPTLTTTTATSSASTTSTTASLPQLPISFGVRTPTTPVVQSAVEFPDNVFFEVENFVKSEQKGKYDVVMLLSVAKWIHLNWGDEGIKHTFKKIYDSLYQGGRFIFEPQEWKSYQKRAKLTPVINDIYRSIQFKPAQFHDFLMNEVGFKSSEVLGTPKGAASGGFERCLYMYTK